MGALIFMEGLMECVWLTPDVFRMRVPFLDIFTSVFLVKTEAGAVLFDTATYPTDITELVLPCLAEHGVRGEEITHVMVSHPHRDHSGGLEAFLTLYPDVTVVAGSNALLKTHKGARLSVMRDGDVLLDDLRVVAIPGHTTDAIALWDTRSDILLSGDGLQLYGIYGSGTWGANIPFPAAHFSALARLAKLPLTAIYAAHDYHPLGDAYLGTEGIGRAIEACREPLLLARDMILESPEADDSTLAVAYNKKGLPTIGSHVFTAVRRDLMS